MPEIAGEQIILALLVINPLMSAGPGLQVDPSKTAAPFSSFGLAVRYSALAPPGNRIMITIGCEALIGAY